MTFHKCYNCEQPGANNKCRICGRYFCNYCIKDHEFYEHEDELENNKKRLLK